MGKDDTALTDATSKREKLEKQLADARDAENSIISESVNPLAEKAMKQMVSIGQKSYRMEFTEGEDTYFVYIAKKRNKAD